MKKPLPIIRMRKPKAKPKDQKPRMVGGGEIGSGYSPGISDGSWLLPDWTREPLEDIGVDGYHHWVPKRRD